MMKQTFAALLERHPGYEIVDFRLTPAPGACVDLSSPEKLDAFDRELARGVREARELTFEDAKVLFG
ncbi:hypothetical protein ACTVH1_17985 [Gluconobacter cerinus]